MSVIINGNYRVTVTYVETAAQQQIQISGATSGNGVYDAALVRIGQGIEVVGTNWTISLKSQTPNANHTAVINPALSDVPLRKISNSDSITIIPASQVDLNVVLATDIFFRADLYPFQPSTVEPPIIIDPPPPPAPPQEIAVGRVYTRLDINDILPRHVLQTTYGIWLGTDCQETGSLLTYHTGSYSNDLIKVLQSPSGSCCASEMFDIVYGNKDGSGSRDLGGNDYYTLSKAIYGQYRNLIGTELKLGSKSINHFYVINVKRDRMGDKLDSGVNEINIHHLSGSQHGVNSTHTGSNIRLGAAGNILRLIDDSKLDYTGLTSASKTYFYSHLDSDLVHNSNWNYLVSGTLETGVHNPTHPQVYGITYPKLGIFMLDADILNISASFLTVTGSDMNGDNPMKLFKALSGSALYTDGSGDPLGFQSRKFKYEYLDRYFVRVKNGEYNFSNNPTWVSGSEGLIIDDFNDGNPEVYMTEIGLYNDNHDLIAIGKINKPLPKNYTTEGLFTITLKYEG